MIFKNTIFFVIIFLPCLALSSSKSKIAIVDVQTVLVHSTAMNSLKATMEVLTKELQEEFTKREAELKKEEEKIIASKDKFKTEEFEKEVNIFNKKVTSTQKKINDKKLNLEQAYSEAVSEVNSVALKIISDLSHERAFSVVFPSTQIVYADEALNITKEVISRLNNKIPSVRLKL